MTDQDQERDPWEKFDRLKPAAPTVSPLGTALVLTGAVVAGATGFCLDRWS